MGVLHLCTFKTPTSWAVMSERGDADCAFQMRNGVNVQRCKRSNVFFLESHIYNKCLSFYISLSIFIFKIATIFFIYYAIHKALPQITDVIHFSIDVRFLGSFFSKFQFIDVH